MAFTTLSGGPIRQAALRIGPRAGIVLLAALLFWAAAYLVPVGMAQLALALVGATLALVAIWVVVIKRSIARSAQDLQARARELVGDDLAPSILTGPEGRIVYSNPAAVDAFDAGAAVTLAGALRQLLANPGVILFRMESRAMVKGAAVEDVVTRVGHMRLSVHRAGPDNFLWRIEKSADRPQRDADPISLPMLTVGRNEAVLFMNGAARNLVGERARTLDRISSKLPLRSGQMNEINTPDGEVSCLVVELEGTAGRREVFLLPGIAGAERQPDGWAFFDDLPVPLLKVARDGAIELSNRPARDLLGVASCKDALLSDMMEGLGRSIADWLDDAAAGRGTVHSEFLRVRREDREVFVQVTLNRAMEEG